jgi:hypothetical protein
MTFTERYGPWAVIAGASEGTGRAFAHKIAGLGLNCILVARREGPLDALAQEIRAGHGVECITAGVDLSAAAVDGIPRSGNTLPSAACRFLPISLRLRRWPGSASNDCRMDPFTIGGKRTTRPAMDRVRPLRGGIACWRST